MPSKLARKLLVRQITARAASKVLTLINSFHGRTCNHAEGHWSGAFCQLISSRFTEGFDYAVANDIKSVRAKADDMTCAIAMELLIQGEGGVMP